MEGSRGFIGFVEGGRDGTDLAALREATEKLESVLHGRRGPFVEHINEALGRIREAETVIVERYRVVRGGSRVSGFITMLRNKLGKKAEDALNAHGFSVSGS